MSLLLTAIQRRRNGVDKNLYGVSAQVIAPGVLVFGCVVGALMRGYTGPRATPRESFARTPWHEADDGNRKPGAADGHTG